MIRTTGHTDDGNRYLFDSKLCKSSDGWAQIDTTQDAWYFGMWLHPTRLEYVSHVEGDQTHIKFEDAAEFASYVRELAALSYFKGIDGMCRPNIIDAFQAAGLGDLLH